ncbi:MAG TPA: exodeoxyribonuclease V subunit gamma [Verrucomicrobiota bacterium]|nr:exodeoxyribonuclease V subunit gamma [Verrucomicrobiales bacterium]HRI13018.1 exodeoxyribonuclease V subunit gamma [Verrucomicrobiota bacterium]
MLVAVLGRRMTGLRIITSNATEALLDRLAAEASHRPADPFRPEVIVVQSRGMARWLQLGLARIQGVSAHVEFPFPKVFVSQVCQALVPEAPPSDAFAPEVLAWRVADLLPRLRGSRGFEAVDRYLGVSDDPRRCFQLARKIAGLFDEYLVFRTELIATWDAGKDSDWQAVLWRKIAEGSEWHPARVLSTAVDRLQSGDSLLADLPRRVDVFGISALPPRYLELLAALAMRSSVTLYLLQPTPEFWSDLVSARDEQRRLRQAGVASTEGAAFHFERGPRLLTTLGRQGQDFLNTVLEHDPIARESDVCFVEPTGGRLLNQVQADLLHLRDRTVAAPEPAEKILAAPNDISIQVHSCHSPLRELEVLHDQLLAWFEADPSLAPRDILVMTPDIETYVPFIHAVFAHPGDERRRIPYSVADRSPRAEGQLADAFLGLLRLDSSRMTPAQVMPLLDCRSLQRRFGFTAADLALLRSWLRELRVNWGLDAQHREALGFPPIATGTWQQAADALVLGQALAPDDELVIGGLVPFTAVEGDSALLAGRFADWISALGEARRLAAGSHPPGEWADVLERVLERCFLADENELTEFQEVRRALSRLRDSARLAGALEPVALSLVLEALTPWLDAESGRGGFLQGGVTFCALKPMRAVPARVIAVLGLNDGAFPRRTVRLSFDRLAQQPRLGDAAREIEDRYLFLETILSARDRLYLSYVGQSARDNTPRPPSVVVSELLDYLADTCVDGSALVNRLRVNHRLQAFSPTYFDGADPRLFSYSEENLGAVRWLAERRRSRQLFLTRPLTPPDREYRNVSLDDLVRFFLNPARFFVKRRLNLALPDAEKPWSDREVFQLDDRSSYALKQEWIDRRLDGRSLAELAERWQVEGALPWGAAGVLECRELGQEADAFVERIRPHFGAGYLPHADLSVAIGGFRITGLLERRTAAGLLHFRCAHRQAPEELRLWLAHLATNACEDPPRPARLLAKDSEVVLAPVSDARRILGDLLELYEEGLCAPLRFFPRSSLAFCEAEHAKKSSPFEEARKKWEGDGQGRAPGDGEDSHFSLCFREDFPDPLNQEFAELARRVWGPHLQHRTVTKL